MFVLGLLLPAAALAAFTINTDLAPVDLVAVTQGDARYIPADHRHSSVAEPIFAAHSPFVDTLINAWINHAGVEITPTLVLMHIQKTVAVYFSDAGRAEAVRKRFVFSLRRRRSGGLIRKADARPLVGSSRTRGRRLCGWSTT